MGIVSKNILDILKFAQDAPTRRKPKVTAPAAAPPGVPAVKPNSGEAPTRRTTKTPVAPVGGVSNARNNMVMQMQQLLVAIGKDLSAHQAFSAPDTKSFDRNDESGNFLNGSDSFSTFLVNQYMAKTPGSPDKSTAKPADVDQSTSKPDASGNIQNANIKSIIQTIQQVGLNTRGQETNPDGVWGKNTDNALKQITSFVTSLLQMKNDMKINVPGFEDGDLATLQNNTANPGASLPDDEKTKRATVLATTLAKFRTFYEAFRDRILNNPRFSKLITQQDALFEVNKINRNNTDHSQNLNDQGKQLYQTHAGTPIAININGKQSQIMPADLKDMKSFQAFVSRNTEVFTPAEVASVQKGDQQIAKPLLAAIIQQLGTA